MSVDDLPPAAIKPVKRRVAKPLAADHVPAMLAASAVGATPVVMPAHVETLAATPVLAPPAAVPAPPQPDEDIMDTNSTIATANTAAQDYTIQGQAMSTDINTRAKGAMEKGQQMIDEMNSFGKSNVEALVESSKIAAKGMETLGQEAAAFARRQVEGATQAMKTLTQTKSPTEFMKLHGDYTRSMFDTMVAQTTRSTELVIKLASDISQPISNRVAVAADKMKMAA